MAEIRSRRKDWFEVTEKKAISYAKALMKSYGYVGKNKELHRNYVGRFVRGLDLAKVGL